MRLCNWILDIFDIEWRLPIENIDTAWRQSEGFISFQSSLKIGGSESIRIKSLLTWMPFRNRVLTVENEMTSSTFPTD